MLTGPDYSGELPAGLIPIRMPLDVTTLIFRADRFTPDGADQSAAANAFRAAITMQPLCAYQNLPCPEEPNRIPGYDTLIFPEIAFAVPFKTVADGPVKYDAIEFLKQLQFAVASDQTPPMTPAEQALSDAFDAAFGDGEIDDTEMRSAFIAGAQAAHGAIVSSYLDKRGPTNWIPFTNIGDWGDRVVERGAITEFIQYGNSIRTAAYYQAFRDRRGAPLDASGGVGYVLTFPADQIPRAERFWSITAYTPRSVELVANSADKYAVASYTPGLEYHPDGSLSVYFGAVPPKGVPEANWLPAPPGPFNVMLRAYGVEPDSSIANDTYVPPAIPRVDRPQVRVPFATRSRVPLRPR